MLNHLGLLYDNGEGVPEDIVLAYMWFNFAATQGDEGAKENKDSLERRMTREQIAEAQRLSREWIEAHPPAATSPLVPPAPLRGIQPHPAIDCFQECFSVSLELLRSNTGDC